MHKMLSNIGVVKEYRLLDYGWQIWLEPEFTMTPGKWSGHSPQAIVMYLYFLCLAAPPLDLDS